MLGALLAILMTFSALPLCTQASAPGRRQISANTIIDTDGSDGYTGDYVVVYNPSEDPENWLTTGDMEGRIETSLECPAPAAGLWNDGKVDSIDALLVLRYASGVIEGGLDAATADVNNDGRVDSADALMILRFALGIVPSL